MKLKIKSELILKITLATVVIIYLGVSVISMIHAIDFFALTTKPHIAISISILFELGAAITLFLLVLRNKENAWLIWTIFIILTSLQIIANTFHAFTTIDNSNEKYLLWSEFLDGFASYIPFKQETKKLILSVITGSFLPVIAVGIIKSILNFIELNDELKEEIIPNSKPEIIKKKRKIDPKLKSLALMRLKTKQIKNHKSDRMNLVVNILNDKTHPEYKEAIKIFKNTIKLIKNEQRINNKS